MTANNANNAKAVENNAVEFALCAVIRVIREHSD